MVKTNILLAMSSGARVSCRRYNGNFRSQSDGEDSAAPFLKQNMFQKVAVFLW